MTALEDITDDVDELVNGATTTADVDRLTTSGGRTRLVHGKHTVHHAALLDQLREATQASTLTTDDAFRPAPASKPSARLDAIAAYQRIDRESTRWAQALHSRTRVPLPDRLRGLIGAAANGPSDLVQGAKDHQRRPGCCLRHAVRSWRTQARVVSGVEAPAFAPHVPCPNTDCEAWDTLRVRFDARVASCIDCGSFWDDTSIEHLGRIVAWSAEHLIGARHWLYDDDGYPVECVECLLTRQQMAERARERKQRATHQRTA